MLPPSIGQPCVCVCTCLFPYIIVRTCFIKDIYRTCFPGVVVVSLWQLFSNRRERASGCGSLDSGPKVEVNE